MLAKDIMTLQKQTAPRMAGLPLDAASRQELRSLVDFCAHRQY
jgi:hypothetical protein